MKEKKNKRISLFIHSPFLAMDFIMFTVFCYCVCSLNSRKHVFVDIAGGEIVSLKIIKIFGSPSF